MHDGICLVDGVGRLHHNLQAAENTVSLVLKRIKRDTYLQESLLISFLRNNAMAGRQPTEFQWGGW